MSRGVDAAKSHRAAVKAALDRAGQAVSKSEEQYLWLVEQAVRRFPPDVFDDLGRRLRFVNRGPLVGQRVSVKGKNAPDPTQAAAFAGRLADPTGDRIRDVFARWAEMGGIADALLRGEDRVQWAEMAGHARRVCNLHHAIHSVRDKASPEPPGAGPCLVGGTKGGRLTPHVVCTGAGGDRLRAGFCPACYKAWSDAGRPERGAWAVERLAWLRSVGRAEGAA